MKQPIKDTLPLLVHKKDISGIQRLLTDAEPPLSRGDLGPGLVAAVFTRNEKIARILLERGADPEQFASIGPSLYVAAMNGDLPIVKLLIEFGANPSRKTGRESALSAALSENQSDTITYLEQLGAFIDPTTELLYAAQNGDLARAVKSLASGAEIERPGGQPRETPLIAAARKGRCKMVEFLLSRGASPTKKCEGDAPLYSAAAYGKNPDIVKLLVEAGADINTDFYGETALMSAAGNGNLAMVQILLKLGANPTAKHPQRGMTAMDFAKAGKHKDVCAVLATLGVTAQRDVGRLLARRLKREFEGSLVEHSDGFLLNAKLAGHRCQFRVDSKDAAAAVFGLKYIAPEFLGKKLPSLTLGHGKPKVPGDENRVRISPSATAAAGMDVYSSLKPKDELEDSLITFCSRLKSEFQKLALQPGEHLHFSDNFAAFVWRDFEPEQTITRLQLFADLLAKLVRAPQPERRLFELEWLIKPALKTAIQTAAPCHRFGGAPDMEICCPHCSAPTDPIIQIDLGDPQLPSCILEHSPLPVHWCLECGEWDATFLPLPHKSTHRLKPSCEPFDAQGPSDDKQKLPVRRMKLIPVASGKKAGRKSKIGGSPSWIQQDETPDCKSCLQPMSFALQMTSDRSISYGDVGVLYAFVCLDCRHVATVVQSH